MPVRYAALQRNGIVFVIHHAKQTQETEKETEKDYGSELILHLDLNYTLRFIIRLLDVSDTELTEWEGAQSDSL